MTLTLILEQLETASVWHFSLINDLNYESIIKLLLIEYLMFELIVEAPMKQGVDIMMISLIYLRQ